MLKVVEMVRRDGPIGVEGLMAFRAYEKFHGHGEKAACHDQVEFKMSKTYMAEINIGREPWEGLIVWSL